MTNSLDAFAAWFKTQSPQRQAGFFVCPGLEGYHITTPEKECLQSVQPAGVILFKRNFQNLAQAQGLVQNIRSLFSTFICIDEEGGRVSRLPEPFPRGKPVLAFVENSDEVGLISQVLHQSWVAKGLGINSLLSPVADILTEATNPVIGDRAAGRDPQTAAHYAGVIFKTLAGEGLFACAKHFPGHGNTTTDSHLDFATSNASLETLRTREWVPFAHLIQQGVPLVMSAHVLVPSLDAKLPATLSPTILKGYLRGELGFSGLILSDDLRMKAIARHYGCADDDESYLAQAAPDALLAGCDVLLSCQGIVKEQIVIDGIVKLLNECSPEVFAELTEKAWRVYKTFSKGL